MSELKVHKAYNRWIDEEMPTPNDDLICNEVYLKSEADKVIADKDKEIVELKKQVLDYAQGLYVIQARAEKEARHQKYKRCLAMAEWCEATALWCYQAANTLPTGFHATLYGKRVMIEPDRLFKRHVLLTKWSARWRELAEKFKPYKEADDGND